MITAAQQRQAANNVGELRTFSGTGAQRRCETEIRAKRIQADGVEFVELEGYATVFDTRYTMWDWYGEYEEQVAATALDRTLGEQPDVNYLLNHSGLAMARTTAGTLTLSTDTVGLLTVARINPARTDVQDLLHAVDDGAVSEMSFAFRIIDGRWNPDYTIYTITEIDINRGDVSAVNYGANPYTSISARSQQAFEAVAHLEGAPLAEVARRAQLRIAETGVAADTEAVATSGWAAADLRALIDADLV